ncbi:uncharacterized protein LOC143149488 [Ptiloglossa arizonensis]|uniref:uncharacterized protein LOC143149488 n=1 Tax=Ptiloglossa arizonensis TaxID=3350558 RepID=UPI003FA0B45B
MLALIFRGVFLVGILTWYSTSVWKLIDNYFKDQFRSYLEEEYRKNPRMKSDVQSAPVDKIDPLDATLLPKTTMETMLETTVEPTVATIMETTVEPLRDTEEVCRLNSCPVELAENDSSSVETTIKRKDEVTMTGGTSENDPTGGSTDKNAFLGTAAESELESRKSTEDEEESRRPINHNDRDLEVEKKNDDNRRSGSTVSKSQKKKAKHAKKSIASRDISSDKSPKTRNVKTITLTKRDFMSTEHSQVSDDDFWEFDEDPVEKEPLEGILVSELPYKPKADIGNLERVTEDEYCPLTLEDEGSCGETVKWP